MIVAIHVNEILIGHVTPPKVNGKSVYVDDLAGQRSPEGNPVNVHDALDDLWAEWREEVENPDTDSEFVDWLVDKHGWKESETDVIEHTIVA